MASPLITERPGLPVPEDHLPDEYLSYEMEEIFLLVYKDGSHITERYFGLRSSEGESSREHLKRAISRGFAFCEKCRYRFVHCQPFLMNLDEIERKFNL